MGDLEGELILNFSELFEQDAFATLYLCLIYTGVLVKHRHSWSKQLCLSSHTAKEVCLAASFSSNDRNVSFILWDYLLNSVIRLTYWFQDVLFP